MFFRIKEVFNAFGLAYDKSMISTANPKTRELVVQLLLIGTFAVRVHKHKIIRILQQSAVAG